MYLVQTRDISVLRADFVALIPTVYGFLSGVLGGVISDTLFRHGTSLSVIRKVPVVLGMLLSMAMVTCNYIDAQAIAVTVMTLSFFGRGLGVLGWVVNSGTTPKQIADLSGALIDTFGNLSNVTTPIAIGYIANTTRSFNGALVYMEIHAPVAIACYLLMVGEIKHMELEPL